MGSDIYIAIGRIKNKKLAAPTDGSVAQDSAVVVFDNKNIPPSDIEAFAYEDIYPDPDWLEEGQVGHPDYIDIGRCYNLFSWLAGRRGDLKPAIDPDVLNEKSSLFMEWLYKDKNVGCFKGDYKSDLQLDGYGCYFYPLSVLLAFNYDQPVVMADHTVPGKNYFPKPGVNTYRDVFPDDWFKLLEILNRDGWDFIVINID